MGMKASPLGLDIVGLASEVRQFLSRAHDATLLKSNYLRYQDDTKAVANSPSMNNLKDFIISIGTTFPSSIPINIDLFHIYGSFLDVCFLRKLSNNNIHTFMKKKFSIPPTIVKSCSMTPSKYKYCTLYSELLRIRRICSKKEYIEIYDKLLQREFMSCGYFSIDHKIKSYVDKINNSFDANMKKIPISTEKPPLVYGSTSVFDRVSNSHLRVWKIVKDSLLDIEASLPVVIPSKKLKSILHTKKRYLLKMRNTNL